MIVCGLDLSLVSTGVAILRDGEPIRIWHVGHKGRDGASYRDRSNRIVSQARAVISAVYGLGETIDLAVIEGPSYGDNMPSNHDRAGLFWGVVSAALAKQTPVAVIAPNTLKLWWTGDGHANKVRMRDTARDRLSRPTLTHDEADAIAAACAGAHRLGDPIPFGPNERQVAALDKVAWPEVVKA